MYCLVARDFSRAFFCVVLLTFVDMIHLAIKFEGGGQSCTATVELEGIADSWDADVRVSGHPAINEFHAKFWMGSFVLPVFESRQDAVFFEPLLEMIDTEAKEHLPQEFE